MRRSLLSAAALTAGAVGGAVLGYLAERTVVDAAGVGIRPAGRPVERLEITAGDGTRLAMFASGPRTAPRILLVHGLSLSQEIWDAQRRALDGTWRVVTIDLRGHGASDDAASGDYTAEALGADVCAAVDAIAGPRCVVVGHSMGGMALLAGLGSRPDLLEHQIAGVALINTAASAVLAGLGGGSLAAGIGFLRERARSSLVGRVIYGGLDAAGLPRGNDLATVVTRLLGVGVGGPAEAVTVIRRLVLASRPHVAGAMWRTVGTLDQLAAAGAVPVPTLIVAGARDRVLPVQHSRRLADRMADAELIELPDVGHVAMLERPDDVSDLLDRFARRVLGQPTGYGTGRRMAKG